MNKLPSLNATDFLNRYHIQEGITIADRASTLSRLKFDFDVYLPTKGMNLQRPLVWTLEQKQALIESIIVKRFIPPISAIYTIDDVHEVIDGKQRLTTLIAYLNNEFEFCGYLHKNLPEDYKTAIQRFWLQCNRLLEPFDKKLSDNEKIEWFNWINFAGMPQDIAHMEKLKNASTQS